MDLRKVALVIALIALVTGCGASPEKKKAKAEAEYTQEKTKTLQEYKECVKKAKEDEQKLDACERLLKAVDATGGEATP